MSRNARIRPVGGAAVLLSLVALVLAAMSPARAVGSWSETGTPAVNRSWAPAVLLANGRVLVPGGWLGSNDRGDPFCVATAELYNRSTGGWTSTGSMAMERYLHGGVLLGNGKVLVAGGFDCDNGTVSAAAELYDPTTGTWTSTGAMSGPRYGHLMVLLGNGRVLVAGGGAGGSTRLASAEVYDPATGRWSGARAMANKRWGENATATVLGNGKVLVAGGCCDSSGSRMAAAELYDPVTGRWTSTGSMTAARDGHVATLLPNGEVLVAGGCCSSQGQYRASAERYNPKTGTWKATTSMPAPTWSGTATTLPSGAVLVLDGSNGSPAHLYSWKTASWTTAGTPSQSRDGFSSTVLANGQVLVTGGGYFDAKPTELYTPAPATCTVTGTAGPDALGGTAGNDVICAGAGDDVITSSGGNDIIFGGPGRDGISYAGAPAGVTANLMSGAATGQGNQTLSGVEDVAGSPFSDTLTGSWAANTLVGRGGGDVLYGLGADDALSGGSGTDTCDGGAGTDSSSTCETRIGLP